MSGTGRICGDRDRYAGRALNPRHEYRTAPRYLIATEILDGGATASYFSRRQDGIRANKTASGGKAP
jgi:hypothetical protein